MCTMLVFAMVLTNMICGWLFYQKSYQQATNYRDDIRLDWLAKLRWVFTLIVCMLAVIGYFTIVLRLSGSVMQPLKPVQYEQVQEPLYRMR